MNHLKIVVFVVVVFPYMVMSQEVFEAEIFLNKDDLNSGLYEGTVRGRRLFTSSAVPHGQGTIYYFNNDKFHRVNYTGDWAHGNRHGRGTTYFRDGSVYTGEYEDGVEEGEGIITYQDGNILEGEFSDGKIHGHAVFKYPNGDKREGFFFENVLDGQVIYTKADGMIVIELWKSGENLEDRSEIIQSGTSDTIDLRQSITTTPLTPSTVEILKPNFVQSTTDITLNIIEDHTPSTTTNVPSTTKNVPSNTKSSQVTSSAASVDLSALRNAIRSSDRTQLFFNSNSQTQKPREPKLQTESMDVTKLRQETDVANREFLYSVFQRVNG